MFRKLAAFALFLSLAGPGSAATLKVMTQNLYVGADLFRAAQVDDVADLPDKIGQLFEMIKATNFPERARGIAKQVALYQPDVIALQEVSLIKRQSPGDYLQGNPKPAEDLVYDYLQILLDRLAEQGLQYKVAVLLDNSDVEAPALIAVSPTYYVLDDLRLIDRDAILVRSDLPVFNVHKAHFTAKVEGDDFPINLIRGYTSVELNEGSVVNTHLETNGNELFAKVQTSQAHELMAYLRGLQKPYLVAGDFNARPTGRADEAYQLMRRSGHQDAWELGGVGLGLTCCQPENLRNKASALYERIDYVFASPAWGLRSVAVFGDKEKERSESGLWLSDHAGVVATYSY